MQNNTHPRFSDFARNAATSRLLSAAVLAFASAAPCAVAQDAPALPPDVEQALQKTVAAQQAGDLKGYADTLASPVAEVFRLHADSAIKVGEAKRRLGQAIRAKFGQPADPNALAVAFDDAQLKASLQRLVSMQIDQAAPSGANWKLQVTTTIRTPDGGTRQVPQGFIAIQSGNTWRVQDLAAAGHLAALRQGAETNWSIFRAFNTVADDVTAGKFSAPDQPLTIARAAYGQITGKDGAPPQGRDEYLAAEKAFNAGDFAASLAAFKRSADKGYPHAAFMVGYQHSLGEGTPADPQTAFEWMKKDAARGDPTALNFLGSMLLEGAEGMPKDPERGLRMLTYAADQDDPAALLNLGRAYYFGIGTAKDPNKGMDLFSRSAALGNGQAAYFVRWVSQAPGNRMFKDESQASAFQQIQLLRANALIAEQSGYRADGTFRAADPNLAAQLRAQADALAKANGLD